MLKGNGIEFVNIVNDNIRLSFYLVYPIKNEQVEIRVLDQMIRMCDDIQTFIDHTGTTEPIKGRINKTAFTSLVKRHIHTLLLSLTPNLSRLVNTRLSEFDKHFSRLMLPHICRWRAKDEHTRPRTKKLRAKAIPKGSTAGDRESMVSS